jgi:hypothetical protein
MQLWPLRCAFDFVTHLWPEITPGEDRSIESVTVAASETVKEIVVAVGTVLRFALTFASVAGCLPRWKLVGLSLTAATLRGPECSYRVGVGVVKETCAPLAEP